MSKVEDDALAAAVVRALYREWRTSADESEWELRGEAER